jgi:hypothetical protein
MAAVSLLSLGAAHAQTTAANADTPAKEDDVIVLSPFVVDSSKDEGYRATSTLAGSRINTNLRDVAAPITVVTKEFMTDTAAVSVNDIVAYLANTEGTRDFTSSTVSLGRPQDNVSINSNTSNRVRGLAAADITRDYFYTISTWVGFDSYNLDQEPRAQLGPRRPWFPRWYYQPRAANGRSLPEQERGELPLRQLWRPAIHPQQQRCRKEGRPRVPRGGCLLRQGFQAAAGLE